MRRKPIPSLENALLAALPRAEYRSLLQAMEPVNLVFGEILYEPGAAIRHLYFPYRSIVSLLAIVEPRKALEIAVVGNEGVAGLPLALGMKSSPCRAIVQGAGGAMRIGAARFMRELKAIPSLQHLLNNYSARLTAQIAQNAACNRFHTVDQRLARWLLLTADRLGSTRFLLTHRFLATMLGVRREGVTVSVAGLKRRQLIDHSRGEITILDRLGLESTSCACYAVFRKWSRP